MVDLYPYRFAETEVATWTSIRSKIERIYDLNVAPILSSKKCTDNFMSGGPFIGGNRLSEYRSRKKKISLVLIGNVTD